MYLLLGAEGSLKQDITHSKDRILSSSFPFHKSKILYFDVAV